MDKSQTGETSQEKMPGLKKISGYLSIFFSLVSFCLVLAIGILGWLALDDFEKKISAAMNNACIGMASAISLLNEFNGAAGDIKNSLNSTSASFFALGDSLKSASDSIAILNKDLADGIRKAGEEMKDASTSLSFADEKISRMQDGISTIRSSLAGEKNLFCNNKLRDEIEKIRIIMVLGILINLTFAVILFLNSLSNML